MPDNTSLDDFRLTSTAEVDGLLNRLLDAHALVTLSGPQGHHCTTMLRLVDRARGVVQLDAPRDIRSLQLLLESGEVVAVSYLDSIKVQFDIDAAMLVGSGDEAVITARLPAVVYRFQRRAAFRVRPFASQSPLASFSHPAMPDMQLSLRMLDISLTGVGLLLPANVPPIEPGVRIGQARLRLDDATELDVGLFIHHVTPLAPTGQGIRLGCELRADRQHERALQLYINQTQKRQLALAANKA